MRTWERRHLSRSGRVLAVVYGSVLALACVGFAVLAGWAEGRSGWDRVASSVPALLVISLCGFGVAGCASMALDRRMPAAWWLLGLAPALVTAGVLLLR